MPFGESLETVQRLSATTGFPLGYVDDVMKDVHFVIDSFVASDVNVLLGPLYFIRAGNPVVPAMVRHFRTEDWEASEGLKTAPPEDLARSLQLPVAEVEAHPCFFGNHIWDALCSWRGVPVDDTAESERLDELMWAWRHDMEEHGVNYRVSAAGLESTFESWLVDDLSILRRLDIHVELIARQPRLNGGRRRADLLCRLTQHMPNLGLRSGDLLVIENKTTPVGLRALRQLNEYVDLVKSEIAGRRQRVGALLIADGTSVELQRALCDEGVAYEALVWLGYREHLYRTGRLPGEFDVSDGTDTSLFDPDDELPDDDEDDE